MPLWPSFRRYFKPSFGMVFCFYYITKINIKQRINLFLEKPNDSFYADVVFSLTITTLEKIEVTDIVFHFLTIKSIPPQSIYTYFSPLIQITDFTYLRISLVTPGKSADKSTCFRVFFAGINESHATLLSSKTKLFSHALGHCCPLSHNNSNNTFPI